MLICKVCGANCDAGDLINGVCEDCREKQEQQEELKKQFRILEQAPFEQMDLPLVSGK